MFITAQSVAPIHVVGQLVAMGDSPKLCNNLATAPPKTFVIGLNKYCVLSPLSPNGNESRHLYPVQAQHKQSVDIDLAMQR